MPGCIEHTGVVLQLLKDAKKEKGDMAILWLDLKNAYELIPHNLVEDALKRHHVPQQNHRVHSGLLRRLLNKNSIEEYQISMA